MKEQSVALLAEGGIGCQEVLVDRLLQPDFLQLEAHEYLLRRICAAAVSFFSFV